MMIKHHPLGRQPIEMRRLDPAIAVRAQKPEMQTVADDDDDIHAGDCSEVARNVPSALFL